MVKSSHYRTAGFTIVELLIVIVIIGILAAVTVAAYTGVQERSRNARRAAELQSIDKVIRLYYADNGTYPVTGASSSAVNTDSNCAVGTRQTDWVPGLVPDYIPKLPQNDGRRPHGTNSGCYKYWSDGSAYVLSAWGAVEGVPQSSTMYRRVGFREESLGASEAYFCNHLAIGGVISGEYNVANDRYKRSYTLTSNPVPQTVGSTTACNESPPAGA